MNLSKLENEISKEGIGILGELYNAYHRGRELDLDQQENTHDHLETLLEHDLVERKVREKSTYGYNTSYEITEKGREFYEKLTRS